MLTLFLLLLLGASSSMVFTIDLEDSSVLLEFRFHVHDPLGILSSWDESVSVCSWDGVTCSANGRVRVLDLESLTLSTSVLASTIAMLPVLRKLRITDANMTGSIMEMSPANCSLEVLHLSHSQLLGSLSSTFVDKCTGLKLLNLSHNHLEGELHESVIKSSLEVLDISYNALNGSLSPSLFHKSCKRLRYLDLSSNSLEGEVPTSMVRNCPSLREISLAANLFSGAFPSLNTSNRLQRLNLASNNFTEVVLHVTTGCVNMTELDISTNIINTRVFHLNNAHKSWNTTPICPSLKVFNISGNSFSGDFFTSLTSEALNFNGFLPSLETLDASFNGFTGELPTLHDNVRYLDFSSNKLSSLSYSLCSKEKTSKLESLIMTNNRLSRDTFASLMHCGSLQLLDLSFNELTGEIPGSLCDALPHLKNLMLWMNRLEGHIPPSIANCSNLDVLHLNFNHLNGTIPAELSQIANLWWLDLSNNRLTGTIPPSFGHLQQLESLLLSGNVLHGRIPYELANCNRLDTFQVNYNNLSGTIPARIGRRQPGITSINAYGKRVGGKLKTVSAFFPKCHPGIESRLLVQGISLEEMASQVNRRLECFSQRFMVAASNTFNSSSMFNMDVSHNNFSGEIPVEIGDMQSLTIFQAEHNSLSGIIPAELGKLGKMLFMDLSYNHLEGSIPATFGNLTSLAVFNVSYNNLSGPIPQAGQMTTFQDSYYGNPYLCGLPTGNMYRCSAHQGSYGNVPSKSVDESDIDDQLVVGVVFALIAFFTTASMVVLC